MTTEAPRPSPRMKVVDHGIEDGIVWATCEAPLYNAVNGYVQIPEGHPWRGLDYDDIDVRVHGGLTYADNGWIGFDCLHRGDYWPGQREFGQLCRSGDIAWDPGMVAAETRQLAAKVAAARNEMS